MTAEGDEYERVPGVIYWGCESTFHMMCIEADQRPSKREWETVIDYVNAHPEEAAKSAVLKQGSLKLTPLGIACQEAPADIVKSIMDVAPEALKIGDKYGDLPIHRAALQNRLSHAEDVMRLLRDADPSTLIKKDGWKRTPLVCALESGRGVPSAAVVEILLGHDGEPGSITNKKGKSPLDIVSSRKDKVSDEDRAAIISKLSVFTKQ